VKIARIIVRLAGVKTATGFANFGVLDFHDLGAEPSKNLGAGRAGFELGEVNDSNTSEEIEVGAISVLSQISCADIRLSVA
jgi:hypothetical protein